MESVRSKCKEKDWKGKRRDGFIHNNPIHQHLLGVCCPSMWEDTVVGYNVIKRRKKEPKTRNWRDWEEEGGQQKAPCHIFEKTWPFLRSTCVCELWCALAKGLQEVSHWVGQGGGGEGDPGENLTLLPSFLSQMSSRNGEQVSERKNRNILTTMENISSWVKFLKVTRFRKPERVKLWNKLSWALGMWMVGLGVLSQEWTWTLCPENHCFPCQRRTCQTELQRVWGSQGSQDTCLVFLPSLSQNPSYPFVWGGDRVWLELEAGILRHFCLPHFPLPSPSISVRTLGDQIPGGHFWPFLKLSLLLWQIISLLCKWPLSSQEHAAQGRSKF